MIHLSSLINTFEDQFLAQYQASILPSQLNALAAMKACRTMASPMIRAQCTACDHQVLVPHSCGHRSCPHCQHHESQQWLERQLKKQLPAEYFLLTFTLPAELRPLAWACQRILYTLFIHCVWDTVRSFSQNDNTLQGIPGAIVVLHTHSRALAYHPHVHLIMPAAAIDPKSRLWRTKKSKGKGKKGYLFNHKALAKVFRAKLLDAMALEGLQLPVGCPETWVANCKSVGAGDKALVYLGRYLYRGVIQEKDIIACEKGNVTYRFKNSKTKKMEYRTVSGAKFLWLVLQHVLPKGFRRTRNFGFLHPNSKRLITVLHLLFGFNPNRVLAFIKKRPLFQCRCCGAPMKIIETRIPPLFAIRMPIPAG